MRPPAWSGILFAVSLTGCVGWRYQAGLASAPGINRPWTSEDFAHDAIANGDESCPRSGRSEDDRLFRRWPACGASIVPAPPSLPRRPAPRPQANGPLAPLRDPDILAP